MNQYTYFILGIVLGLCIAIVYFINKEEREERILNFNRGMFSSNELDNMLDTVAIRITERISELNRKLTDDEKNEIIRESYKEKFELAKERK